MTPLPSSPATLDAIISRDTVTVVLDPETQAKADAKLAAMRAYQREIERGAMQEVPASINRHTGKPHEHARARRRYLRQRFQAEG